MIKLTATAPIRSISPIIEIASKTGGQNFKKRELVLDDSWEREGNRHVNFVSIDFSGDSIMLLDNFRPGQWVTVEAYVNGREHNGKIFNTIKGRSITPYQSQQQPAPAQSSAQGFHNQQAYPTAPEYPQQASYPAGYPQQSYPSAQTVRPQSPGVNNLPFDPI